jgi:hypothetical protein
LHLLLRLTKSLQAVLVFLDARNICSSVLFTLIAGAAASFRPAMSSVNNNANPSAAAAATMQAPAAAAAAAAALPNNRLLLASHGRLMWYFPETDEYMVLHEGEVRVISVCHIFLFLLWNPK